MHVLRAGWLAGWLTTNNNNSTHMYCVIVIMSPTSVRVWHVCVCVSNTESAEWSCVAFVYVSMCLCVILPMYDGSKPFSYVVYKILYSVYYHYYYSHSFTNRIRLCARACSNVCCGPHTLDVEHVCWLVYVAGWLWPMHVCVLLCVRAHSAHEQDNVSDYALFTTTQPRHICSVFNAYTYKTKWTQSMHTYNIWANTLQQ